MTGNPFGSGANEPWTGALRRYFPQPPGNLAAAPVHDQGAPPPAAAAPAAPVVPAAGGCDPAVIQLLLAAVQQVQQLQQLQQLQAAPYQQPGLLQGLVPIHQAYMHMYQPLQPVGQPPDNQPYGPAWQASIDNYYLSQQSALLQQLVERVAQRRTAALQQELNSLQQQLTSSNTQLSTVYQSLRKLYMAAGTLGLAFEDRSFARGPQGEIRKRFQVDLPENIDDQQAQEFKDAMQHLLTTGPAYPLPTRELARQLAPTFFHRLTKQELKGRTDWGNMPGLLPHDNGAATAAAAAIDNGAARDSVVNTVGTSGSVQPTTDLPLKRPGRPIQYYTTPKKNTHMSDKGAKDGGD